MAVSIPETQQHNGVVAERPDFGFAVSAGVLLAFNAGFINAISLLSLFNLAVSHVTGSTSNLGIAIARGDLVQFGTLAFVIFSYFSGNVLAALLVHGEELDPGHRYRYGLVLLAQTVFVLAAIWFFKQERLLANYALAVSCGLQNGMATRYSGATVRTSHMTGIVTDLGILVGQRLKGMRVALWRVQLLSALLAAFLAGGIVAGVVFQFWGYRSLWISAIGTAVAGLTYSSQRLFAWLTKSPGEKM